MTTDDRPVHRDPAYEDRDPQLSYAEQEPARAGWDLAFGCKVSFGPYENGGPLLATVSMSDRERLAGLCQRIVTAEQVYAFAQHLIRLVARETGEVRCRTNDGIVRHEPATALIDGEPRCGHCVSVMGVSEDDPRWAPMPVPLPEPKLSAVTA